MRCARARRLLLATVDPEIAPAGIPGLDEHLAGCAPCRAELDRIRRYHRAVRGFPTLEVPPGFEQRVLERVREAGTGGVQDRPADGRSPLFGLAATPALAACLCLFPLVLWLLGGALLPLAVELRARPGMDWRVESKGSVPDGGPSPEAAAENAVREAVRTSGGTVLGARLSGGEHGTLEVTIALSANRVERLLERLVRMGLGTEDQRQPAIPGGLLRALGVPVRLRLRVPVAPRDGQNPPLLSPTW